MIQSASESSCTLLSYEKRGRKTNISHVRIARIIVFIKQCPKTSTNKGKMEINVAKNFNDHALIFYVENLIRSWILDSGMQFHVSHSISVMHNFRHYSSNVSLANNKSLDIMGFCYVVLNMTLGIWFDLRSTNYSTLTLKLHIVRGIIDSIIQHKLNYFLKQR